MEGLDKGLYVATYVNLTYDLSDLSFACPETVLLTLEFSATCMVEVS